jgi:peptide/nickel transport system permease protein
MTASDPGAGQVAQPRETQPRETQPRETGPRKAQPGEARPGDPQPRNGRGRHAGVGGPTGTGGQGRFGNQNRAGNGAGAGGPAGTDGGSLGRVRPASLLARVRTALAASPLACAALAIIAVVIVFCFVGPVFYHWDQAHVHLSLGNKPPGAGHPLGTDANGVDILGQLMVGGQLSLEAGVAAGVLAAVVGSLWGAVAGYLGGFVDAIMMRIVDAAIAIPALVLLLLLVTIYSPSAWVLVIVIAATSWLGTARLVRAEALTLRVREYVQAVRVMGGGGLRAILRHIAPNAAGTIAVNVTFQVANAILTLATLSYLGLGVQPPSVDWGDMIGAGIQYIDDGYWWQIYPAGLAIICVVVAFTMLGDGLRDGFQPLDPRQ